MRKKLMIADHNPTSATTTLRKYVGSAGNRDSASGLIASFIESPNGLYRRDEYKYRFIKSVLSNSADTRGMNLSLRAGARNSSLLM